MNTEKNNAEATTAQLDALFSTDTVEKKIELKKCDALAYYRLAKGVGGTWENGRTVDGLRHYLSTCEIVTSDDFDNALRFYFSHTDNWVQLQEAKERRRQERKAREAENARKRAESLYGVFQLF